MTGTNNSILVAHHPVPSATRKWGYDHLPDVFHKPDPQWERITDTGSFGAGLCRLVSGWNGQYFSRGPDSWISLDTYSIGFAHWWADTARELLDDICTRRPDLAAFAWGEEAAKAMTDPNWLMELAPPKRGKMAHDKKLDWLVAGWYAVARHPDVIRICVEEWLDNYVPAGLALMSEYGWRKGTSLAGLVRITNSRGDAGMRRLIKKAIARVGSNDNEEAVIEMVFTHKSLYGHSDRLEYIRSMSEFSGGAPRAMSSNSLDFAVTPQRVDGSVPPFVGTGL